MSEGNGLQSILARLAAGPDLAAGVTAEAGAICAAFRAQRLTLHAVSADGAFLEALVQSGLEGYGKIRLPLDAGKSVAGYAGRYARLVNIRNVYDKDELRAFAPPLQFLGEVDRRTGFRTREMLAAPILTPAGGLLGAVQILNRTDKQPFPRDCETGLGELCRVLAGKFAEEARRQADLVRELETLKQEAEAGMSEDAPPAAARAREKLLQRYRTRHAESDCLDIAGTKQRRHDTWTMQDVVGLEWLCRLTGAGHAGARRLVERALDGSRLNHSTAEVHSALDRLAKTSSQVAGLLARREFNRRSPDLNGLMQYLQQAGGVYAGIAAGIAELYDWPRDKELDLLREHVPGRSAGYVEKPGDAERVHGDLLAAMVAHRDRNRAGGLSPHSRRLMERAAALGSQRAVSRLWSEDYAGAADKAAFVRDWLAGHPDPSRATGVQCLYVGVAIECGQAGMPADPAAALRWYVAALRRGSRGIAIAANPAIDHAGTCFTIGDFLESYVYHHLHLANAPDLALAWYERGLDLGSIDCLERWLGACTRGELGLNPDPDAALDRVNRCIASGMDVLESHRELLSARRAVMRIAKSLLYRGGVGADPALGAKWMQVAAQLCDFWAMRHLGVLYARGHGVARDAETARFWLIEGGVTGEERLQAVLAGGDLDGIGRSAGDAKPEPVASADLELNVDAANEKAAMDIETKLDLAQAYFEVGDRDGARDLLDEVMARGNDDQRTRARELLERVDGR